MPPQKRKTTENPAGVKSVGPQSLDDLKMLPMRLGEYELGEVYEVDAQTFIVNGIDTETAQMLAAAGQKHADRAEETFRLIQTINVLTETVQALNARVEALEGQGG